MKKILSAVIAMLIMIGTAMPVLAAEDSGENGGSAESNGSGSVIINQVYGGSNDGAASHSFIELYNKSDEAVDMKGWTIQYRSSADGNHDDKWYSLELTGSIEAGGYYLVRCGAVDTPGSADYQVPAGDQEWDIQLHNKGLSVVLMSDDTSLDDRFTGDVMAQDFVKPASYVDLAAVQGNDGEETQTPPAWEGSYSALQSKKKAVRRVDFADTDNNETDFKAIDYSKAVSADMGPHSGSGTSGEGEGGEGGQDPEAPAYTPAETSSTKYTGFFNDTASLKLGLTARYNSGASSADGGSAEISAYNSYNGIVYSVNGVKGTLDYFSIQTIDGGDAVKELLGEEIDVAELIADKDNNFTYGDMTSVAVSPDGTLLAVALQDADYTRSGRVAVFNCSENGGLTLVGMAETGVQPDMVTFNDDGSLILTANEGEPREGYISPAVDPAGSVTIITAAESQEGLSAQTISFESFDGEREQLISDGIVIKKNTDPSVDLEPEYITVSGSMAYVTLQEANAIATLDLDSGKFTGIYSAGFEDFSEVTVDLDDSDKAYSPEHYDNVKGLRMPDGISSCVIDGETYLITANEGDSREWEQADGSTYENEEKQALRSTNDKTAEDVRVLDTNDYDGLNISGGTIYTFGSRSFTMFKVTADGLEEVFDSGSDFEEKTAAALADYFNCSNDNTDIDDRSAKKGPEPEAVTVGTVGSRTYAFIGLERIGGIMVYDITDPSDVTFDNYINSRDFSGDIKDDVSPEGLCFISSNSRSSSIPLLLSSNEVSGTVSVMALTSGGGQTITDPSDVPGGNDSNDTADDPTSADSSSAGTAPETGDDSHLTFWLVLVLVSGSIIAAAAAFKVKSISSK